MIELSRDYEDRKYEEARERWLARRPVCALCEENIQDEFMYVMPDGTIYCPDCIDGMKQYVEE